jgi:hypothetical protein
MSDDIKQDRSPRSAALPLEDAIVLARKLYANAGKSTIKRDSAFKAIGYGGQSGASLGALATLVQYGLVKQSGGDVSISDLALRIFHPLDGNNEPAIKEAALTPPTFKAIHEAHHNLSEPILANQLVHLGFNLVRAKKVASIYKANCVFSKLDENEVLENKDAASTPIADTNKIPNAARQQAPLKPSMDHTLEALANINEFSISIGDGRLAKIPFPLSEEDFDTFIATLNLWKRKLVRQAPPKNGETEPDGSKSL